MHPRRQLIVLVVAAAALIGIAWAVLFRRHVLAPQVEWGRSRGFTEEISHRFTSAVRSFTDAAQRVRAPTPTTTAGSDGVITPEPSAPLTNAVPAATPSDAVQGTTIP
ncbi:hypothetical protein HYV74_03385 [Candidatus Uhrbacteria bacterium]|nr:hypothetical protein [Candidatus Uhrbacteria bacterium]